MLQATRRIVLFFKLVYRPALHSSQELLLCRNVQRRLAAKSIQLRNRIDLDQVHNGSIYTEGTQGHGAEEVQQIEDVEVPTGTEEAAHPAPDSAIARRQLAGAWVEPGFSLHGGLLDLIANVQKRRERVRKLQDADGGDDAGEAGEIGNRCSDYIGDRPVDGDESKPDISAALAFQRRSLEKFDKNIVIEHCRHLLACGCYT